MPDDGQPAPALVVILHGCTQTASGYDQGSGWSKLADDFGFAVLFPEQSRENNANLCFNWFVAADMTRDEGEVRSIREMIESMVSDHGVDPKRVYITGLSAGGAMANALLAAYPEMFAGGLSSRGFHTARRRQSRKPSIECADMPFLRLRLFKSSSCPPQRTRGHGQLCPSGMAHRTVRSTTRTDVRLLISGKACMASQNPFVMSLPGMNISFGRTVRGVTRSSCTGFPAWVMARLSTFRAATARAGLTCSTSAFHRRGRLLVIGV